MPWINFFFPWNTFMECLDSRIWSHGFGFRWLQSQFFVWISLGFFVPFTPIRDEWEDKYAPFGPKSFRVHPTGVEWRDMTFMKSNVGLPSAGNEVMPKRFGFDRSTKNLNLKILKFEITSKLITFYKSIWNTYIFIDLELGHFKSITFKIKFKLKSTFKYLNATLKFLWPSYKAILGSWFELCIGVVEVGCGGGKCCD